MQNDIKNTSDAIASSDLLLALYRKTINAHYFTVVDEYKDTSSYAGMRKRAEKFDQAEKEFLDALTMMCEKANAK